MRGADLFSYFGGFNYVVPLNCTEIYWELFLIFSYIKHHDGRIVVLYFIINLSVFLNVVGVFIYLEKYRYIYRFMYIYI